MYIIKVEGNGFASNTYVLRSEGESAVVDPSADLKSILEAADDSVIKYILLTHGHFDHILTLDSLADATGAEILIHEGDLNMPSDPSLNASGYFGLDIASKATVKGISNGGTILLGNESITVISTPGHTPGSSCYICNDILVCGDTLFSQGFGRYDLPGGNRQTLFSSLKQLANFQNDPVIYPGHGASCTLSHADIIKTIRNYKFE